MLVAAISAAHGRAFDPPERVARISDLSGEVVVRAAHNSTSDRAVLNLPIMSGDQLTTRLAARAELSLGIGTVHLGEQTRLTLTDFDQNGAQLNIESGTVSIQVSALQPGEAFGVKAHRSKLQLRQGGLYRVTVSVDGRIVVTARKGEASIDTGTVRFQQLPGEVASIASDRTVNVSPAGRADEFDRWASMRQRARTGERTALHVPKGLVGFEDLDAFGTWFWEPDYGMVWSPSKVSAEWVPYRFGQWFWKEPWGWTWIDDTPWGFAPSHYGRWVQLRSRWCWIPGPRQIPPVYAPALVAWAEDATDPNIIGWFPLGPAEEYVPMYQATEQHTRRLNIFSRARTKSVSVEEISHRNQNLSAATSWETREVFEPHPPATSADAFIGRSGIRAADLWSEDASAGSSREPRKRR